MVILKGPPGSGKSTWAREFQAKNPNYLIVSRDAIRESLVPNHRATWYQRADRQLLEQIVTRIVDNSIEAILNKGLQVLIDETNPDTDKLSGIASERGVEWVIHEMTTPIEECIRRDSLREYPVGAAVIHKIATKMGHKYAWANLLGQPLVKKSGKPFPTGKKTEIATEIKINPHSQKPAFLIGGYYLVDCEKCEIASHQER